MKRIEGFVIGVMLIGIAAQIASGDWGDVLDGVVILGLYLAWTATARRADRLADELREYRRLVYDITHRGGAL